MITYYWQHLGEPLSHYRFSGHSALAWITTALLFAVIFTFLKTAVRLSRKILGAAAHGTAAWPALLDKAARQTKSWFLATLAAAAACYRLAPLGPSRALLGDIVVTALFVQAALWGHAFIKASIDYYRAQSQDGARSTVVVAVGLIATILLWLLLTLAALSNLGVNVTALLAGFGVGGIALALAVQSTLADFLASLWILFDKPFVLDDFIAIDAYMGTVEHIGLKTTRLRSPSGEQIIIGNSDIVKSRMRNYKRMRERTLVFTLYLAYENTHEALARATIVIEDIVRRDRRARFVRAHFTDYQPQGLAFEVAYCVGEDNIDAYRDVQHAINLAIFQAFREQGIELAHQLAVHAPLPGLTAKEAS
ncbi:mechanosensitive ion channel family protein [Acidiferrobacter sp.]|jgi:small-conductance mechanosensitive channel|uniref:mechanosensitive ion channel family protein n=1 Tax=Acidiferrobacter sp. TaxID=1872107 RepID=UPI00263607B1|nr:mechanosensitive ion channel family protein [Acidiferrobacter sp.]